MSSNLPTFKCTLEKPTFECRLEERTFVFIGIYRKDLSEIWWPCSCLIQVLPYAACKCKTCTTQCRFCLGTSNQIFKICGCYRFMGAIIRSGINIFKR